MKLSFAPQRNDDMLGIVHGDNGAHASVRFSEEGQRVGNNVAACDWSNEGNAVADLNLRHALSKYDHPAYSHTGRPPASGMEAARKYNLCKEAVAANAPVTLLNLSASL